MYICNCTGLDEDTVRDMAKDLPFKQAFIKSAKCTGQCKACMRHLYDFLEEMNDESTT